jgi:hypothetical protein
MTWLALLARLWKPLAAVALLIGAGLYIHHAGYRSGHAASEARWQPLFQAAEKARDAANTRADAQEAASTALTEKTEADYAATLQALHVRADAADGRVRQLVRNLAARARCGALPEASGPASSAADAGTGDQRADQIGIGLVGIARDCEADAAQLDALRGWVGDQLAILR